MAFAVGDSCHDGEGDRNGPLKYIQPLQPGRLSRMNPSLVPKAESRQEFEMIWSKNRD